MKRALCIALTLAFAATTAMAHVGAHPSVHDTIAGIIDRLRETLPHEELVNLTADEVIAELTEEEKHVLATEYLTFDVNVPVVVTILHDVRLPDSPFWLVDGTFTKVDGKVVIDGDTFDIWQKEFDAGTVGLGVSSISDAGDHYVVAVRPQNEGDTLEIANIYPGLHTSGTLQVGARAYADDDNTVEELPESLAGQVMIRGLDDRPKETKLLNVFRATDYPSSAKPDHIVLTWSDDPKTSQTVQWRTSPEILDGVVSYYAKEEGDPSKISTVIATMEPLETPMVVNDPLVHRYTATMADLEPGTTYIYSVGDGADTWSEQLEFTTAPADVEPFSFVYMGDAQNGLETWGELVRGAYEARPEAAFYIMAGDLVNRGAERDDWDVLFENAQSVYTHRQLVPALGNHEYQGGNPELYLRHFDLLKNGPSTIEPEKAYSFTYSNALFVVLDSNMPAAQQTEWLEEQLANTDATWKFVVYHHPAYSSGPGRNNPEIRKLWGALFDKYHVDVALQGHDHAYLRTYPMHNEQRVATPAEGTIYIVSVSGTKYYDQGDFDYTEFGMTNVSTYQLLDIEISDDKLTYRAYDMQGEKRDEFTIEK